MTAATKNSAACPASRSRFVGCRTPLCAPERRPRPIASSEPSSCWMAWPNAQRPSFEQARTAPRDTFWERIHAVYAHRAAEGCVRGLLRAVSQPAVVNA